MLDKKSTIYKAALTIVKKLQNQGFTAYFVGGIVRDMLLEKKSKDIDIVTSALPEQVDALFEHTYHIGAAFGIINVVESDINFEVATFREEREYLDGRHPETVLYTDDPELDAIRRDFTINGMFFDPVSEQLYDYVGGQDDAQNGIIRTIGDAVTRFEEDYLRMMRAVRFATRFDFEIDPATVEAIQKLSAHVATLSAERIREELTKMLVGPNPHLAFERLDSLGILRHILPEISAMKGVTQSPVYHPEGDVFVHTMLMLKSMNAPTAELAWSVLLHDVGKPSTFSIDDDGVEHFYGHEAVGSDIAESIMKRLRFSKKETEAVVSATKNHMRFAAVHEMRPAKWRRIIAAENFEMELELHRIDCLCSNGIMENYELMKQRAEVLENEPPIPAPLLVGSDLIALGMKPGPEFGTTLQTVADHQLNGTITTKEEALEYVKSHSS